MAQIRYHPSEEDTFEDFEDEIFGFGGEDPNGDDDDDAALYRDTTDQRQPSREPPQTYHHQHQQQQHQQQQQRQHHRQPPVRDYEEEEAASDPSYRRGDGYDRPSSRSDSRNARGRSRERDGESPPPRQIDYDERLDHRRDVDDRRVQRRSSNDYLYDDDVDDRRRDARQRSEREASRGYDDDRSDDLNRDDDAASLWPSDSTAIPGIGSGASEDALIVPPLQSFEVFCLPAVKNLPPSTMACNRTRLVAEIMLAIKISPIRTTEYKTIVLTAIGAEGIKYKMDMDFVKEESSYAFRLIIDNDIELGYGAGKAPQEAETDGFRELVETIRCCDYLIVREAHRRSVAFKVHFFETFQLAQDGSFRYDLLCKERRVADKDLPVCDYCKESGHILHFCMKMKTTDQPSTTSVTDKPLQSADVSSMMPNTTAAPPNASTTVVVTAASASSMAGGPGGAVVYTYTPTPTSYTASPVTAGVPAGMPPGFNPAAGAPLFQPPNSFNPAHAQMYGGQPFYPPPLQQQPPPMGGYPYLPGGSLPPGYPPFYGAPPPGYGGPPPPTAGGFPPHLQPPPGFPPSSMPPPRFAGPNGPRPPMPFPQQVSAASAGVEEARSTPHPEAPPGIEPTSESAPRAGVATAYHDDSSSNGSPTKRRRSHSSSPDQRRRRSKEKNAFEVDPANARPEEKLIAEIMKMTKENINKTTVRDSEMFLSDVFSKCDARWRARYDDESQSFQCFVGGKTQVVIHTKTCEQSMTNFTRPYFFQEIVDKLARNEYLKVIRQDDKQVLLTSEPGPLVETLYYFYKDLVKKSSLESDRPVHPENVHVKVVNIRGAEGEAAIDAALENPTGFERKLAKLMKYLKADFPFIVGERKEWQAGEILDSHVNPDQIESLFRQHVSHLGLVLRFEVEITDAPSADGSHKREMFLNDVALKKEKIDASMRINVEQFIIRKVVIDLVCSDFVKVRKNPERGDRVNLFISYRGAISGAIRWDCLLSRKRSERGRGGGEGKGGEKRSRKDDDHEGREKSRHHEGKDRDHREGREKRRERKDRDGEEADNADAGGGGDGDGGGGEERPPREERDKDRDKHKDRHSREERRERHGGHHSGGVKKVYNTMTQEEKEERRRRREERLAEEGKREGRGGEQSSSSSSRHRRKEEKEEEWQFEPAD